LCNTTILHSKIAKTAAITTLNVLALSITLTVEHLNMYQVIAMSLELSNPGLTAMNITCISGQRRKLLAMVAQQQ
jgi:hypothetical protein